MSKTNQSNQSRDDKEPRYVACPANAYGIHQDNVGVACRVGYGAKGWPTASCPVCGTRCFLPRKNGWTEQHGMTKAEAIAAGLVVLI